MSGKVFAASSNVHEDQAEVLFEYYRQAAEEIVRQEEQIEKDIAVGKEEQAQLSEQVRELAFREKAAYGAAAVIAGLAILPQVRGLAILPVLGALGFGVYCLITRKRHSATIEALQTKASALKDAHKKIRRDYRVNKLGVAYVPVAGQIAFEGKSFLVDYTDTVPKQEFRLNTVRRADLFTTTVRELEALLSDIPIVEGSADMEVVATDQYSRSIQNVSYYDYLGSLDRKLRATAYCLEDLETSSVSLPVVFPNAAYAGFLSEYGTSEIGDAPVIECFSRDAFDDELETFRSLNETKKALEREAAQFEEVLRGLMSNVASTVQTVTQLKMASAHMMIDHSNRVLFKILQAPYNHYSPRLEADEIERIRHESFDYQDSVDNYSGFQLKASSRVRYDPVSDMWVAEDGSRTGFPFGMPQIEEEIIAPIVQSLMQETRLERLKIYNGIKDQKISYLNKWHQDTEDFYGRNRAESNDLINQMRSSFTEFIASYNALSALEKTEKSMASSGSLGDTTVQSDTDFSEVVASYEMKAREYQTVQEEFASYMERLKEDIDRRAVKFGFIQYYDASLRDGNAKRFSEAVSRADQIDERRRPLLAVNPFYAEVSELSPRPVVEPLGSEHAALNLEAIVRQSLETLDEDSVESTGSMARGAQ